MEGISWLRKISLRDVQSYHFFMTPNKATYRFCRFNNQYESQISLFFKEIIQHKKCRYSWLSKKNSLQNNTENFVNFVKLIKKGRENMWRSNQILCFIIYLWRFTTLGICTHKIEHVNCFKPKIMQDFLSMILDICQTHSTLLPSFCNIHAGKVTAYKPSHMKGISKKSITHGAGGD